MGPKALLPYRGRPLVESVAGALLDGGCREVIVVLGAGAATVRANANLERFLTVVDPMWQSGMGSSYLLGSSEADPADHLLMALVDQPGLTPETVARLLSAHRQGRITAAAYGEGLSGEIRRGHPLLIDVGLREAVSRTVTGDVMRVRVSSSELTPNWWTRWSAATSPEARTLTPRSSSICCNSVSPRRPYSAFEAAALARRAAYPGMDHCGRSHSGLLADFELACAGIRGSGVAFRN